MSWCIISKQTDSTYPKHVSNWKDLLLASFTCQGSKRMWIPNEWSHVTLDIWIYRIPHGHPIFFHRCPMAIVYFPFCWNKLCTSILKKSDFGIFFPPDNHLFGHSRSSSQRCREPTQDGSRLRSQTFVLWRPPKVDECKYSMQSIWWKGWNIVSEELCRLCYCFFWCGWTSSSCICRMTELSHRQPNPAFYSGTYGESQCVLF